MNTTKPPQSKQTMSVLTRYLRHTFVWRPSYKRAFNPSCMSAVQTAVQRCESTSSAQVCVIAEHTLPYSYLQKCLSARDRALTLFGKHRVWDTEHNTGVLIYINWVEHAVEIVADRGLAGQIDQNQWRQWANDLQVACAKQQYREGLIATLEAMCPQLQRVAPRLIILSNDGSNTVQDEPVVL